ncbi:MAG: VCBS repeat-containing protein [Labilithrix sp.]|nr:VCBS repeat-containing protein [Labilithrix sp.]
MKSPFVRALSLLCLALVATFAVRAHAAWPPAPGADMKDQANWPNDFAARWNYISYFPERAPAAGPIDAFDLKLGAAGMSIDRAWTHTIGRPDVKIAVIDSGIEWDAPDLVNKAALNLGELKSDEAKPRTADDAACGGAGPLAGYDCNGDGVFNVADYRDDPRISPVVPGEPCFKGHDRSKPGGDRIKGDLNRNCILDPGDIILMFSDGVDDDANGYTDDICGWDFFKNDNDPYDDTRYGHGTGEARDSSAEANNGEGEPGVCPGCTFIPLRVGDSFIGDANDFAKATIYAADIGAKVVQEALGTVNQSAFSKAAIDYAYAKGSIIIASMADENSRHHNMPATANHVLTVHSIRYNEGNPRQASTFVAFDTCSNYGGHLSLSVSGTSCSSEAVGRGSGIAGLLYSAAANEGITLTAEEAIQLFKMEADDIDVAESRVPESPKYYYSHAGFDQRFGYGRSNALRLVEAIKARRIPPEVDIVSPEWFTPIHADRAGGPIQIMGRVAATRARSYDFKVQWAPGVQPAEADYRDVVAPLTNIPAATVSGGAVPLAQLDPAQIDPAHARDPDSALGENDRSISIRVRAVAHYDAFDVPGEARRVVSITNEKNGLDKDLLPGFPIALGASAEASPKLADIDGDGVRDIVAPDSSGKVHVFSMKTGMPAELPGFPYLTRPIDGLAKDLGEPTVPSYLAAPAYAAGAQGGVDPEVARESLMAAPAVADIDGDGKPEIVFTSWPGSIYVINGAGQDLPGWPKRLPLVPSCPHDPKAPQPETCMDLKRGYARGTYSAPVVVDMNKDGKPEIVIGGFDGKIWVFKADASVLEGFPVSLVSPQSDTPSRIMATPTVADLNGDGIPEIISGTNQQIGGGGAAGPVFVVDGRGTLAPGGAYLPNWPMTMASLKLFPVVAEGIVASQAVADFDGDGRPDIVIQGNGSRPIVVQADPGAQARFEEPPNRLPVTTTEDGAEQKGFDPTSVFGERSKAFTPDVMFPLFSQPSIGDLDQDGVPDVIVSGGSLSLAGALAGGGTRAERAQQLIAAWSGKTGKMLPGMPLLVEDYTFLVNHAIADVSGDAYPEIITGTGGYFLHAADGCGREAEGFPKFTHGWIAATAAVGDIDGDADKSLEVVVGTRDGWLFAWHTRGTANGAVQWESFHHDNANTGNYATKLDQGTTERAATPLECPVDDEPADERFEVGGGCACRTAGRSGLGGPDGDALLASVGLAGAAVVLARRRRARSS